jgi:hypothetical protein
VIDHKVITIFHYFPPLFRRKPVKSINLKLNDDLHAWLAAAAKADHRSIAGYTSLLILRHLEETQVKHKPYAAPTTTAVVEDLFGDE